jgi:hypothetical protein
MRQHAYKLDTPVSMVVSWIVTPCGLISGHQRFGGTDCLHLRGCSTETLVPTCKSTWRHNQEIHRHFHRREDLKPGHPCLCDCSPHLNAHKVPPPLTLKCCQEPPPHPRVRADVMCWTWRLIRLKFRYQNETKVMAVGGLKFNFRSRFPFLQYWSC